MRHVFYFSKKVRLFSQNDVLFLFYFLINPAGTTAKLIKPLVMSPFRIAQNLVLPYHSLLKKISQGGHVGFHEIRWRQYCWCGDSGRRDCNCGGMVLHVTIPCSSLPCWSKPADERSSGKIFWVTSLVNIQCMRTFINRHYNWNRIWSRRLNYSSNKEYVGIVNVSIIWIFWKK